MSEPILRLCDVAIERGRTSPFPVMLLLLEAHGGSVTPADRVSPEKLQKDIAFKARIWFNYPTLRQQTTLM